MCRQGLRKSTRDFLAERKGTPCHHLLKYLWEGAVQQLVWNLRFIKRQVNVKESTAKVQLLWWNAV